MRGAAGTGAAVRRRALDPEEAAELREHLAAGCPACAGRLAEARAILALLPLSLTPVPAPPAARRRLLERVRTAGEAIAPAATAPSLTNSPTHSPAAPPPPPWWVQVALPAAIAASIAAMTTIFFAARLNARQPAGGAVGQGNATTVAVLTGMIEHQQQELERLRTVDPAKTVQWAAQPDLKIVPLAGTDQQPAGARGRVFWDADHGRWHFFASGLKPALPGKTYELWFVSADGKTALPAGGVRPDPVRRCVARVGRPRGDGRHFGGRRRDRRAGGRRDQIADGLIST